MTTPVQPTLDGTLPQPGSDRPRTDDFDTWMDQVRPAFERAAATGLPFTSYAIAEAEQLPEPPDTAHHWGRAIGILRDEGLIVQAGWDNSSRASSHGSGVKTWRGTRAARRSDAA